MTATAWVMIVAGFGGLGALCFRVPESEKLAFRLFFAALVIALSGVLLLILAAPYEAVPKRTAGLAPIAGAPLVFLPDPRVDQAFAAAAEMPLRRLAIADSDVVLP